MKLNNQKQQYFIRGVEKMQAAQNSCKSSAEDRIKNVAKTIGRSKIYDLAREHVKGPKTRAAIIPGIFQQN